jgi:hypothetical protein
MIGTRLTEVHQDADSVPPSSMPVVYDSGAAMTVCRNFAADTFFGASGMAFVSGGENHILLLLGSQQVGHRTYDDDIRAQVSTLWAEDWDSDQDEW